ncbi:single-stranded DNA-binding protein [Cnuibacter physcomitrellae]|uniref:single-stranded DNA-binding protein n=1 Tax=Cnuibacter physcomitrellae TaxID=1619308 RepID=UPI00217608E3|nr:single-stranded DNA-binding protein [Cnuibacter physcomitrellae]MCS5498207.1 single-stranded DNA-binding protein [Cnuibacter physcomitrellae]
MSETITVTGIAATAPRHILTEAGLDIVSFRLASTQRRYDPDAQKWVDGDTNWYTVTGFRRLAVGVTGSIRRGEHVIVTGRIRVRDWETEDRRGTSVEIEADAIGHDLTWGTTVYTKTLRPDDPDHAPATDEQDPTVPTPF